MLELRNITKRFGNVLANDRVNIAVQSKSIHAIIGENGAGKSTAMKIAYGFYRPDDGEILVDGRPAHINNPHDAIALGIGMVHQHFMLVDTMTVAENMVLGAEPGSALALDLASGRQTNSKPFGRISPRDRSRRNDRKSFRRPAAAGRTVEGVVPAGSHSDSR